MAEINVGQQHQKEQGNALARHRAAIVRSDQNLSDRTLRTYLSERLVDYQRPTAFVFLEALPRNAMGKVLRRELLQIVANG